MELEELALCDVRTGWGVQQAPHSLNLNHPIARRIDLDASLNRAIMDGGFHHGVQREIVL